MKKHFYVGLSLLLLFVLSSCTQDIQTLDVKLKTHTSIYVDSKENIYRHIQDVVVINDYDEYRMYLVDQEIEDESIYHERDYFVENVVIIIPVYSDKNPDFELGQFSLKENLLEIQIIQNNSFIRTGSSDIDEDYYTLELFISSKIVKSTDVTIIEKNMYYDFKSFASLDASEVFDDENIIVIRDYTTFESIMKDFDFYGYESFEYEEIYSSDIFDTHILILCLEYGIAGKYTVPIDVSVSNVTFSIDDVRQYVSIEIDIVGASPNHFGWDLISFVLIDKELITDDKFNITIIYD